MKRGYTIETGILPIYLEVGSEIHCKNYNFSNKVWNVLSIDKDSVSNEDTIGVFRIIKIKKNEYRN